MNRARNGATKFNRDILGRTFAEEEDDEAILMLK